MFVCDDRDSQRIELVQADEDVNVCVNGEVVLWFSSEDNCIVLCSFEHPGDIDLETKESDEGTFHPYVVKA